jgi:glycogen debranching enzyme
MREPYLHDLICAVRAPAQAISGRDGQVRAEGAQGVFVGDLRILSHLVLTLDGVEPASLQAGAAGDAAWFVAAARGLGDDGSDPTVLVRRDRRVIADGVEERIAITSYARAPVRTRLAAQLGSDLAAMQSVRTGRPVEELPTLDGPRWSAGGVEVRVTADIATDAGRMEWPVDLRRGETFRVTLTITVHDPAPPVARAPRVSAFAAPDVRADDPRLAALVARSVADLDALLLADPQEPDDVFLGAGVPWYLTLFGRDAVWAARMLLPLGTDLAAGTLRTLARRQGVRSDDATDEQPGKIMHELRRADLESTLPPVYYGTVDATSLWISLLHDAWRWGLPSEQVADLLPALEAALGWLSTSAEFVSYRDVSGSGLANQGWKDSPEAVQFATARSPSRRSPCPRCRGTRTRPPARAPTCSRHSAARGRPSGAAGRPTSPGGSGNVSG